MEEAKAIVERYSLICGSMKPPRGHTTPSAARELLRIVKQELERNGRETEWLDLRDLHPPLFDGRMLEEYQSSDLSAAADKLRRSHVIIMSCPAYWSGPSGALKNFLDILGGPNYRKTQLSTSTPLEGKTVALLVVGADEPSAQNGATCLRSTLAHLGGWVAPRCFTVGDPRQISDQKAFIRALKDFARYTETLGASAGRREIHVS